MSTSCPTNEEATLRYERMALKAEFHAAVKAMRKLHRDNTASDSINQPAGKLPPLRKNVPRGRETVSQWSYKPMASEDLQMGVFKVPNVFRKPRDHTTDYREALFTQKNIANAGSHTGTRRSKH
uniref:Uncharacterized protein n=1 Tax=Coccolithus braarudii TaxID=221442 RepID=A0A7S0PXJ3_9EUKA